MASFYVIRGKDNGQHFAIRGASATIGREATNQIQLRDTEVSRRHARIIRTADSNFEIVDAKSSNGTFVNGRKITAPCALKSGDRVQIGRSLMIFTGGPELQSSQSAEQVKIVNDGDVPNASQIRSSIVSHASFRQPSLDALSNYANPDAGIRTGGDDDSVDTGEHDGDLAEDASHDVPSEPGSLEVFYQVAQAIHRTIDLPNLLSQVLGLIFQHIDCDRGCVLMIDDQTGQLTPVASLDRAALVAGSDDDTGNVSDPEKPAADRVKPLAISRTILDHVCETKEGVLTSNAQDDERWQSAESVARLGVQEAMCVPMLGRYGLVGAIYVDTSISPGKIEDDHIAAHGEDSDPQRIPIHATFHQQHLKLMIAIAGNAALAVEDTQFYTAMMQSERLAIMGQTIANLSHHIKNVLQGVSGGNYLVDEGLKKQDLEVLSKGWELVKKNQSRISNLVMDMLSYSKDREPNLSAGDLRELIDDIYQSLKVRADRSGIQLRWKSPEEPVVASFDGEAIHRALLNVVTNALDAVKEREDPQVAIEVEISDGTVQLLVLDNGPGIEPEDQERIFVPFESTKGAGGTGLGLPVSQKILREHGGDLTFRTKQNKGTAFILSWPVVPDLETPATIAR